VFRITRISKERVEVVGIMVDMKSLIKALVQVESGGNSSAIGDNGDAYGILQIHQGVVADVNRTCKTNFTHEDAFDGNMARDICSRYLAYWGRVYQKTTQKEPSEEVLARIWNGGPKGYEKQATMKYWSKVKEALEEIAV